MKSLLAGFLLLSFVTSANAVFTSEDYLNAGDGLITRDSDSGLEWLDLTETTGMSYNQVIAELGAGGSLYGWEYATGTQFETMLANYTGYTNTSSGLSIFPNETNSIDDLIQLLSNTNSGNTDNSPSKLNYSEGLIADTYALANNEIAQRRALLYDYDESSLSDDFARTYAGILAADLASTNIGSFLVRSTTTVGVSEASSLWLLAMGMLGLFGAARRNT